jgi:hypothetical protein
MDGKVTAGIVGGAAPELDNGGGDAARVIAGERDGFAVKVESFRHGPWERLRGRPLVR